MFYLNSSYKNAKILFIYKSFATSPASHAGLGVGSMNAVKCLRSMGIQADAEAVANSKGLITFLEGKYKDYTHVFFQAIWMNAKDMAKLCYAFPKMHFITICHSNWQFLAIEPGAIAIINDLLLLQDSVLNYTFAGNNERFCRSTEHMHHTSCLYLPNLYDLPNYEFNVKSLGHDKDVIQVDSFSALRLQKNLTGAASAAIALANLENKNVIFNICVNRVEGNGSGSLLQSIRNMFRNSKNAKLNEVPWAPVVQFRNTVAQMDLGILLSASETNCIVALDHAARGIPCVVSDAIEWMDDCFKAPIDDPLEAARVAQMLLSDKYYGHKARKCAEKYVAKSKKVWTKYLNSAPNKNQRTIQVWK